MVQAGAPGALAAKQLCVTAQLRGSAFDAFNIRTSELLFILRRKVRVSQPGQIAQGKFHFPFVGPSAFMCWAVHCGYHTGRRRLAGPRHMQPIWGPGGKEVNSSVLGAFQGAQRRGHCRPDVTSLLRPLLVDWLGNFSALASPTGLASLPNKDSPVCVFTSLARKGMKGTQGASSQPAPSIGTYGICSQMCRIRIQPWCSLALQP